VRKQLRGLLAAMLLAFGSLVTVAAAPVFAQEDHGTEAEAEGHDISHAAEECIHLLEEGGEPDDCAEAPSPILPATDEIIWGALSFLVLLLLMWKFAFPALKSGMDARAQRIRDNLDEAERTKAEAQRILEDYQRQLADAKNESARIIEEARQTAEQLRRDLMARAEAESQELRQRVADDVRAAQDRALADVRAQVAELAIGAAEAVVQKNLDPETNRALVERFIEQVGSRS
jgi:F-type H+-transporting ATPase subunit b